MTVDAELRTTIAGSSAGGAAGPSADTVLDLRGTYDLREVALMGFGHRDERSFDGVMRLAFCVDGGYERQVGVEVRQHGSRLVLHIVGTSGSPEFDEATTRVIADQVARVLSADQDGQAFEQMCQGDPLLSRLLSLAPGFRPALFHSPYEAAVWSIISARRVRSQGIALRTRLAQQFGTSFDLAGVPTVAIPTPSQLLAVDAVAGLPADRIPRLHAVARTAAAGALSAERLLALDPAVAMEELQELPGIGPFYSTLILIRACGTTDVLPVEESKSRTLMRQLYGWERNLSNLEYAAFAERWRPFRTWAVVTIRALGPRLDTS
jgi:DNA-3-methyladenine glycosylase II